jgi:hypothetical protein
MTTRRNRTNPDDNAGDGLSPAQELAIALIIAGRSLTDVAAELELTRQTLSRWTNHDPDFRAVLNQRRQELWAGAADALRALVPTAVAVLAEEMQGVERLKAATAVLKAVGMASISPPNGLTDPAEIAMADEERENQIARRPGFAAMGL